MSQEAKKKKGPLRLEAIIPFLIVVLLSSLYYTFFFDNHLKKSIELIGSYTYGAEINIDNISTSIRSAKLEIENIQVTDTDQLNQNLLQIEQVRLALSWDALLRAKAVITDAAIEGITLHSQREYPGKLYRDDEAKKEIKSDVKEGLNQAKKQVLSNSQKTFSDNIFGDAANLLDGADPTSQIGTLKEDSHTKKKIEAINTSIDQKEKNWKERFANLPNKEKFNDLNRQLKALKFDSSKPKEFANSLKEGGKLLKEAEQNIKSVKTESSTLQSDIQDLKKQIKELEKTRALDIASLQNRVKIPDLDTKTIANVLFGQQIAEYQNKFGKYIDMAREYLPESDPNSPQKTGPTAKERALGKNYKFTNQKSYPLFWLQKASISSKSSDSSTHGNVAGTIIDLTSNPALLGKPAIIDIAGEFPKKEILGVKANVNLDHRGEKPIETIKASVGGYPVPRKDFSKSEKVKFGFTKATGQVSLSGTVTGRELNLNIHNAFRNIKYFVDAKSSTVREVLQQVVQDTPQITVDAHLIGDWKSPAISIRSNLAQAIGQSFKRQLQAKIAQAKKKLAGIVDSQLASEKAKLTNRFNALTSKYTGQIDQLKKQANSSKDEAQKHLNQSKSQKKAVEQKAKKELQKVFKKFKF